MRVFFSGALEHIGLLQHQVLPIENSGHAPEALIFAHHEALEEGNLKHGDKARASLVMEQPVCSGLDLP